MTSGKWKVFEEDFERLKASENQVLSLKRVFSEEDIKSSNLLMFILLKIRIWTGKLIKIIIKNIRNSNWLLFHFHLLLLRFNWI